MGAVRAMVDRDLPQVAALYERVIGLKNGLDREHLRERLMRVFVDHPWRDARLPSRVYEEADGSIVGCLGVVPRPMTLSGKPVMAAISHSFLVQPSSRASLAALHLVREFLAGPQDLAMCQGDDISRKLWEMTGGATSQIYSLCWTRPLKPSRYVLSFLKRRGLSAGAVAVLDPCCRIVDALSPRFASNAFTLPANDADGADMDGDTLCESLPRVTASRSLTPTYNAGTASWMLETLTANPARGGLHKTIVRDGDRVLGWYVYFLQADGMAEVVQLAADEGTVDAVLNHLFHQATADGAVAVSGQVDPMLFRALSGRQCVFHHENDSWMLVHARNAEIRDAISSGRAFISRMEGEWWISALLR